MRDRLALQQSRCSSGRDNLNTHLAKTASKRNQTSLIGYGNESAIDLHGGQKIIKGTVSVENRPAPACPLPGTPARRHAETSSVFPFRPRPFPARNLVDLGKVLI